jgi:hypothetical protein
VAEMKHEFWEQTIKGFSPDRDLTDFKTWDEVRRIPLYSEYEYADDYYPEVCELLRASPYQHEWQEVLSKGEPRRGHTEESYTRALYRPSPNVSTTGFRLKSLHHVLTFEKLRQKSILDYDCIVEFGAGIGDTAHTIFDRGYRGAYIIVDFAEIARISNYYLGGRAEVVHSIDDIPDYLPVNLLFIATWSLSETPLALRNKVAEKLFGADYLILFQFSFYGTNNMEYFIEQWPFLTKSFYRIMPLRFHQVMGGSWYMVGTTPLGDGGDPAAHA